MSEFRIKVHHQRCICVHCRCQHRSGYEGCIVCAKCVRYTWPGAVADLPEDHALGRVRVKP